MYSSLIITNGQPGSEKQCIALAESAGLKPRILRISKNYIFSALKFLVSYLCYGRKVPDLVIASGADSIPLATLIKRMSKGQTFVSYIQYPRVNAQCFDLIILPKHDSYRSEKTFVTNGALHNISKQDLESAKKQFPHFFELPSPRIAVLIGATNKAYQLDQQTAENLIKDLLKLKNTYKASLFVTTSPRTDVRTTKLLAQHFNDCPTFFWRKTSLNPYLGYLACADYIIVTSDSVSMISEASATEKPIMVYPLRGGNNKFDLFHGHFHSLGITRKFSFNLEPWSYKPLNDTSEASIALLESLKEFQRLRQKNAVTYKSI